MSIHSDVQIYPEDLPKKSNKAQNFKETFQNSSEYDVGPPWQCYSNLGSSENTTKKAPRTSRFYRRTRNYW
jgi:hypothetical protein